MICPPVAIVIPVLGRPHRVRPLLESIHHSTPTKHRVLFVADPNDTEEQQAIRLAGADMLIYAGSYAVKINRGIKATDEPLIFTAADDVQFTPGWLAEACYFIVNHGAQVVGTNDLCSARVREGRHATHFVMTREYAQQPCIDGSQGPLCQAYSHSCVDDELVATAMKRGVMAFATDAIVEHKHPDNGGAEMDDTYRKGRQYIVQDKRLFRSRRRKYRF